MVFQKLRNSESFHKTIGSVDSKLCKKICFSHHKLVCSTLSTFGKQLQNSVKFVDCFTAATNTCVQPKTFNILF